MTRINILVTEDNAELRDALADTLELAGFAVAMAGSGEQALQHLDSAPVDLVVTDVNMPGMDGHALLQRLRDDRPFLPVILMTAYGSVTNAVDAMRNGAVDYLVKPFQPETLVDVVRRQVGGAAMDGGPVAASASGQALFELARRVAETDASVLLQGESGVGKEVVSRYIHQHSPRRDGPFIALNCAAIPEQMLEAVMFGHEKGAFTGAVNSAPGKFEQANGGTLLLDEVSEMALPLQAKLLRVLQEREVERVGGRKVISLDVRVVATTNRELQAEVKAGRFREDLFYRLSVFPLPVPALRERREDIGPLADHLLEKHARRMGRPAAGLDDAARQALIDHNWPGNVRELDNVIQRALILRRGAILSVADLHLDGLNEPLAIVAASDRDLPGPGTAEQPAQPAAAADNTNSLAACKPKGAALSDNLRHREFDLIIRTLRDQQGSRRGTAQVLGISERTLRYKLQRMRDAGIDVVAACA